MSLVDTSAKGVKDGKIERRGKSDDKVQKKVTVLTNDSGGVGVFVIPAICCKSTSTATKAAADDQKENQSVAVPTSAAAAAGGTVALTLSTTGNVSVRSDNDGTVTVKVTTSKKGAVSKAVERRKAASTSKKPSSKHPVSYLVEICHKRKWDVPEFVLLEEKGPAHTPTFLFKVIVNEIEYKGRNFCKTKKAGKADAAKVCLDDLSVMLLSESLEDMDILQPD